MGAHASGRAVPCRPACWRHGGGTAGYSLWWPSGNGARGAHSSSGMPRRGQRSGIMLPAKSCRGGGPGRRAAVAERCILRGRGAGVRPRRLCRGGRPGQCGQRSSIAPRPRWGGQAAADRWRIVLKEFLPRCRLREGCESAKGGGVPSEVSGNPPLLRGPSRCPPRGTRGLRRGGVHGGRGRRPAQPHLGLHFVSRAQELFA
mmetsp:Transcript_16533/g.49923  ORF Transcript_16533/g.49923 Transcript_16533/m.49923 type:complete len:202 (+) Transcript_16533:121-726(+)